MKKLICCLVFMMGCASVERDCSSMGASNFGADWIVVQYEFNGTPLNCWKLQNTAITNEQGTDGIYWQDSAGHLVHISGWYNRVQVQGSRFKEAATSLGIDLTRCDNGAYAAPATSL